MSRINIINFAKKIKAKFENISKLSATMLISGQLFILALLFGSLAYIIFCITAEDTPPILDLLLLGSLVRYNALVTLGIVWVGALFIDCLDKDRAK